MSNSNPIGIFDSGIGGTSILKEIISLLPNENTVYLSDSKNAPYGDKNKDSILNLSVKNTELLIEKGCKIIVVACNTATTNTISYLRENYDIPFIGIEPAIKPAALKTKTNCIGILATKGTLSSALFSKTSEIFASNVKIIEQVGTGLVELIESGKLNSKEMTQILKTHMEPMIQNNIDYLVLGCTHYPYLIPQIRNIIGSNVQIIDSGLAVAKQTQNILSTFDLLNFEKEIGAHQFFINTNPKVLKKILLNIEEDYSVEKLEF
ncbi:MAG: glutamate racemase [Flavobacteriaceae bacterium]|nr:glutamate racemase [Flavobacteriaceae bacterium]